MNIDLYSTGQMLAQAVMQFNQMPKDSSSKMVGARHDGSDQFLYVKFLTEKRTELRVKIYFDDAAMIAANDYEFGDSAWAEFRKLREEWGKFMFDN